VAGSVEAAAPGRAESTGVTVFRMFGGATSDCGSGTAIAMMNRVQMSNDGFAQVQNEVRSRLKRREGRNINDGI
jgi:hypothetical protein